LAVLGLCKESLQTKTALLLFYKQRILQSLQCFDSIMKRFHNNANKGCNKAYRYILAYISDDISCRLYQLQTQIFNNPILYTEYI